MVKSFITLAPGAYVIKIPWYLFSRVEIWYYITAILGIVLSEAYLIKQYQVIYCHSMIIKALYHRMTVLP
jgi:hypothetical protein